MMLMARLQDRGVRIPEDISVMGFDDNLYGKLHRPALTTVHQDPAQKGVIAARTLLGMLQGKRPESREIILDTELVIRDSVRDLNKTEV